MQALRTGKIERQAEEIKYIQAQGRRARKKFGKQDQKGRTNTEQAKQDRHDRNEDKQTEEKDRQTGHQHRKCR
jgi:hypothetical protein